MHHGLVPNCNPLARESIEPEFIACDSNTILNVMEVFSESLVNLFISRKSRLASPIDLYFDEYEYEFYDFNPDTDMYYTACHNVTVVFGDEGYNATLDAADGSTDDGYIDERCDVHEISPESYACDEWGCYWVDTTERCFLNDAGGEYCY